MVFIDPKWHEATRQFWLRRRKQSDQQIAGGGVQDAGSRSSVTGGKHLDPLTKEIVQIFQSNPQIGADLKIYFLGKNYLPGWFRETKSWDIIVVYRGVLVAAVELKSQVGSFGNNQNNRIEEAIGNAVDLRLASEYQLTGDVQPWTAFVMVVENSEHSRCPVSSRRVVAPYESDPVFAGHSYVDRYRLALQRLHAEGRYDAVVLATSSPGQGIDDQPDPMLSFANLEAAIAGRLAYIAALPIETLRSYHE